MELLDALRVLSRRPFLLVVGLIATLIIALLLMRGAGATSSAVASTRLALDTPRSQIVNVAPAAADTLLWRAGLLVDLLSTEDVATAIAREAGLRREDVMVVNPVLDEPEVGTPLARAASEAAARTAAPYSLTATADDSLPFVTLAAAAPTRDGAERLAAAATETLEATAPTGSERKEQPYSIERYAAIEVETVPGGRGPIMAIAIAFAFFVAWCCAVTIAPALLRAWQAAFRTADRVEGRHRIAR